jgi:hypothetical protein
MCTLALAVVQAVSRWLPIAAVRVRALVRSCGICGGQSGTGVGFIRVRRFLLPINPTTAPHSSSSGVGTIVQVVAHVLNGLSLTPPRETNES